MAQDAGRVEAKGKELGQEELLKVLKSDSAPSGDFLDRLERISALYEKGALTQDEFLAQKAILLDGTSNATAGTVENLAATPTTASAPASAETATPAATAPTSAGKAAEEPKPNGCKVVALWILGIFIFLVLLGAFSGKDKPAATDAPPAISAAPLTQDEIKENLKASIRKLDSSITQVDIYPQGDGKRTFNIFFTTDILFNPFLTMGKACKDMAKKMVEKGMITPNENVLFFVHVPTVDKLGNEGTGLAMKVAWSGDILTQINWKNMYGAEFLNLAYSADILGLMGREFEEFLQDADNIVEYEQFLRTVLKKGQ